MNANDRRRKIVELLAVREFCTMESLADSFGVTRRTIVRDIATLSQSFPLYTTCGPHGGVYIMKDYRPNRRQLIAEQKAVLEEIEPTLPESEQIVIDSILRDFAPSDVF